MRSEINKMKISDHLNEVKRKTIKSLNLCLMNIKIINLMKMRKQLMYKDLNIKQTKSKFVKLSDNQLQWVLYLLQILEGTKTTKKKTFAPN